MPGGRHIFPLQGHSAHFAGHHAICALAWLPRRRWEDVYPGELAERIFSYVYVPLDATFEKKEGRQHTEVSAERRNSIPYVSCNASPSASLGP